MTSINVQFEYRTGIPQKLFQNVRLTGSWDFEGRYSDTWTSANMNEFTASDGCPAWRTTIRFDKSQIGKKFRWGVIVDRASDKNTWGIIREISDSGALSNNCEFQLSESNQIERYWLTNLRRLGANKEYRRAKAEPGIIFSVWAPNARSVELVLGDTSSGYIWDQGASPSGLPIPQGIPLEKTGEGIWISNSSDRRFASFSKWKHQPYMYQIVKDDGTITYRTDLYSRCQIGYGHKDPANPKENELPWNGSCQDLDGTKSCSVVVDPEKVNDLKEAEFWANEFNPTLSMPTAVEDLIIYELHVSSLGFETNKGGTLQDAVAFLDHLVELGVNAVELMPVSEFEGGAEWGYGTSHYFAVEFYNGGRDQLKHFVRECHRRGIAVILDVVYNHYTHDGERAEWLYDSNSHHRNIYYWYEGEQDWGHEGHGGYLDNGSTGYSPNFRSEMVRRMFISSAASLITEFHIDGLRVDLTQAIHRDHVIHANGDHCPEACRFGVAFLREWVRALRLINPEVFLLAEDHSGWDSVIAPQANGGIGFDATWWSEWYHHLIGDATNDSSKARLIRTAGLGENQPLRMDWMSEVLRGTHRKIIYHESHDEAGNSSYEENGQRFSSARTIMVSVNGYLFENTRPYAEARSRVAVALTMLSPGTPMFFMAEEVGAANPYRFHDFLEYREDIKSMRRGSGAKMFRFYQDLISLRRNKPSLRSPNIEIVHAHNENRILAFLRSTPENEELLVVISLNNSSFSNGYWLHHDFLSGKKWREILNSDYSIYGGKTEHKQIFTAEGSGVNPMIPSNSVLVFQKI